MAKEFNSYKILICLVQFVCVGICYSQNSEYNIRPFNEHYAFSYLQTPENLVPVNPAVTGTYQWEKSDEPVNGFATISGATAATYTFTVPLAQTAYFRRKITQSGVGTFYSNTIKIEVVSVNWEDINYVREHDIRIAGQTDWKVIDQLPIGQKMQTTTYLDGLGRPVQKISRETATPASGTTWGDMVQFSGYDAFGRQPKQYLPYTTTAEPGKYKTNTVSNQAAYYTTNYNETFPYNQATFDNSPLNRVMNVKQSGTSWAAGNGNSVVYELNDGTDDVKIFGIGYTPGDVPLLKGVYPANELYKTISTDEYGKKVIEYVNKSGQSILTKVQLDDSPAGAYAGWICTYNVYDDFGLLRYSIQPEGVKWLEGNSWSFAATNGPIVLKEQCFRYEYDIKKRLILKKAPGAEHLLMLYDNRDRVVLMQDGNQRAKTTAEWTVNIYDDLDRVVLSTLYTTSKTTAQLQTDIDNAPANASITLTVPAATVNVYRCFLSAADLNNSALNTIVKVAFYDNYGYTGVKSFSTSFDNMQAYATGGETIAATERTISMPTGSITRVLGTTTFLTSSVYYDDKGRPIQTLKDNIKTGVDITTLQYQWDGRLLSTNTKHSATGTVYTNFSIVTKNLFDKIGRVTGIEKKYGSNAFVPIATYDFDNMSRLKAKHLAPSAGLETLEYSYNIHNSITGINKDYALKAGSYNKWGHYFGMYLGYDNRDNVFTTGKLDGHVTGILWNTMGDDAQRKYDFTYDNAGRLTAAAFKEKQQPGDAWSSSNMDFSVGGSGAGNKITYDLNGNLVSMLQKGVIPGNATPVTADDLVYSYKQFSNQLLKVTDNGTAGSANGKQGDFADGSNGSADDYVYDANGNLVIDLNKNAKDLAGVVGANGIRYNYLDKPEEIRIAGKGVIKIVYDADGNKLQRSFTTESTSVTKTTSYINQFVYEDNTLQYISFEEGRIRVMQAVSQSNGFDYLTIDGNMDLPDSKRGAIDYFIRDYQANVRMILTSQSHAGSNSCTLEPDRAANEEPLFGQVDANGNPASGNEVAARVKISTIPGTGWTDNTSKYASRVGALAASKIGPNSLLKVMAGDRVSARTDYFYENPVSNGTGTSILTDLLGSLVQVISGGGATTGLTKSGAANIGTLLNGSTPFATATSPDANNIAGTAPKAYLTILFFDERFNFVPEASTTVRVHQDGNGADPLVVEPTKAPKNGYAYVYVSNESDEHVYFDNLQVTHERGPLLEENHYYAYGLRIAAISSRKLADPADGATKNNYLYQGEFSELDEDIAWTDFALRNYDAQIGRWVQRDPYDEFPSGYEGMGNDPINFIDPSGGFNLSAITGSSSALFNTAAVTVGGALVGAVVGLFTGGNGAKGALIGAGVGLATGITGSLSFKLSVGAVTGPVGRVVVNAAINGAMAGLTIAAQQLPQDHVEHTVDEYISKWEKDHGQPMSEQQKHDLARGCIGITVVELGNNLNSRKAPPLDNAYSTFEKAKEEADKWKKIFDEIPVIPNSLKPRVIIFSVRFWSKDPTKFRPDTEGKIDMTDYDYKGRPATEINGTLTKFIKFDYGLYEEKTNTWWHANRAQPGMKVYQSTLEYYSRPLLNFNRQIFAYALTMVPVL